MVAGSVSLLSVHACTLTPTHMCTHVHTAGTRNDRKPTQPSPAVALLFLLRHPGTSDPGTSGVPMSEDEGFADPKTGPYKEVPPLGACCDWCGREGQPQGLQVNALGGEGTEK